MRIAIVEDEKKFADDLIQSINEWIALNQCSIDEIIHYECGEDLLRQKSNYDLIFLDITLEGISGIETAKQLRTAGFNNAIVFITNHKEFDFVRKGFDVNALNYFAKPVTLANIDSCMKLLHVGKVHQYCYNGHMMSIPYKYIAFFESRRNDIIIHTINKEYAQAKYRCNMATLLKQLPECFVQINRSIVVNVAQISIVEGRELSVIALEKIESFTISEPYLGGVLSAMRYL